MSRCFPFPPPGYERKARANDLALLKQEKHKEKKHKKEKRDKEKRKGKEKKEKDRCDEKHRDKKDKRRDKKEKDKERENDRSSTSYEKKQPVQTGYINEEKVLDQKGAPTFSALQTGEKSVQKEKDRYKHTIADIKRPSVTLGGHNGETFLSPTHVAGVNVAKGVQELAKRLNSIQKEKDKFKHSIADIKRPSAALGGHNGERVMSPNHVSGISDVKGVQELAKRLKNDQCSGSELASAARDHRKNDCKDQLLGKAAIAGLDGKERTKARSHNNEPKLDERVNKEQSRLNGTVKVQCLGEAPGQKKLQEIPKSSEVSVKKMECREIITGREDSDMQADKLKEKYINKSQGKVKELGKKEERAKETSEQKHVDQEKLNAGTKNGVLGSPHLNSLKAVKEPNRISAAEGNLKKRKEFETNGFLLGDEVRAHKLHKQTQGLQLPMENGMELCQISTKISPPRAEQTNKVKVNREEKKINGIKGAAHSSHNSSVHPPLSSAQAELLLAEASSSLKLPHPDSKFLSEILKVPKLDELSDLDDDQAWLCSRNKQKFKKSSGGRSFVFEGTPEVWGESLHIESADIYAMPYVFPY